MIKIFIFDFDGTLTTQDMLDEVCDIVGKKEESIKINYDVINGNKKEIVPALCQRVNFLKGVTTKEINDKLSKKNYLREDVKELFNELNKRGYITIVSSGSIVPVLKYYQKELGITYVFGSDPNIENETIVGINEKNYKGEKFKYQNCFDVINKYQEEKIIYAIGDSAVDIEMLSLANKKFAIDPKGGLENHVDYVIKELKEILNYID